MRSNRKISFLDILAFITIATLLAGCGEEKPTFSLLPEQDEFSQSSSTVNNKVDILWIVDGSGTMANHQSNLAANFGDFIADFADKGFDFQMAVASTDAWLREVNYNGGTCSSNPNPSLNPNTIYRSSADCANTLATFGDLTKFRDGDIYGAQNGTPGPRSGVYLITSMMSALDISNTFSTNVRTGTRGDGTREAGFQSLRAVLRRNADGSAAYNGETHTALASFRRESAFLAVIIVSDEEDQSRKQNGQTYATAQEYTDAFIAFMDGYTGGVEGNRRYNVSSIVINDINNCAYGLHPQATQGDRYVAVAGATGGVVGNICSNDFSNELSAISQSIVTLSTRFQLSREPVPSTITVRVNGNSVPESATNGWTYVAEGGFHFIEFHGAAIPPQGASISVDFDPVTIK
ncbi:MAG TPA: hypothetical protein VFV50_17625 [Bdellovibrionales bacterium]|nr:hypothetical protein [Bdellovibrionales bacterium]